MSDDEKTHTIDEKTYTIEKIKKYEKMSANEKLKANILTYGIIGVLAIALSATTSSYGGVDLSTLRFIGVGVSGIMIREMASTVAKKVLYEDRIRELYKKLSAQELTETNNQTHMIENNKSRGVK